MHIGRKEYTIDNDLQQLLRIPNDRLEAINEVLLNPDTKIIQALLEVVAKYGSPQEINRKAAEARKLENLLAGGPTEVGRGYTELICNDFRLLGP